MMILEAPVSTSVWVFDKQLGRFVLFIHCRNGSNSCVFCTLKNEAFSYISPGNCIIAQCCQWQSFSSLNTSELVQYSTNSIQYVSHPRTYLKCKNVTFKAYVSENQRAVNSHVFSHVRVIFQELVHICIILRISCCTLWNIIVVVQLWVLFFWNLGYFSHTLVKCPVINKEKQKDCTVKKMFFFSPVKSTWIRFLLPVFCRYSAIIK